MVFVFTSHSACQGEENQEPRVTVTYTSPEHDQVFNTGNEIKYSAEIQSDISIHGYELFEKNVTTGDSVLLLNKHTHGEKVQIYHSWTTLHSSPANIELVLKVLINHEGLSRFFSQSIRYE